MTALAYATRPAAQAASISPDGSLLARLAAGDESTWRGVVTRYEGLLRASARAVLRNDADVDEAVQRTWVLLLDHATGIHDAACLPGWLSTTARREALAIVRGQQRAIPSEDVTDHVSPDDRDLATAMLQQELTEALHSAVEALPETQRRLVRALLREPASYDTLSRELGIPRGSLGPLRGRAVRALRSRLEPCFA
jgi:RNA polymerase sigma factor (sigma-70 family)